MLHTDETTKEAVSTLEGLISILEDGKLGYTNAAEHVENPAMKSDFLEYARERSLFIVELQDEINKLGKSTDTSGGGPLGALHRTWIDIKSSFTGGDTQAIINACVTGEEAAIEKYKKAKLVFFKKLFKEHNLVINIATPIATTTTDEFNRDFTSGRNSPFSADEGMLATWCPRKMNWPDLRTVDEAWQYV